MMYPILREVNVICVAAGGASIEMFPRAAEWRQILAHRAEVGGGTPKMIERRSRGPQLTPVLRLLRWWRRGTHPKTYRGS
jgi:hypothetical protein